MSESTTKVCVLGAGSYGTAIAVVIARKGHDVMMYCRDAKQSASIANNHTNPKRFADFEMPHNISATSDLATALDGAAVVIHAVPAQHTPAFVTRIAPLLTAGVPYVSTAKGVHTESHMLMSDAISGALGERASEIPLAYLSGPSFAKEMIQGHPMSVVVASEDLKVAEKVQQICCSTSFRIYITDDVIGVEVGGALKNPLAIGAGIASGLGYGQSTVAAMVTRGCREMAMLSLALGGRAETLSGLSGVGDLMLTCFSSLSRNNRFGGCLARGLTVDEAIAHIGEVVEGYPTAGEVARLAEEHNLRLPLFQTVDQILQGNISPADALSQIMSSPPGLETRPHDRVSRP